MHCFCCLSQTPLPQYPTLVKFRGVEACLHNTNRSSLLDTACCRSNPHGSLPYPTDADRKCIEISDWLLVKLTVLVQASVYAIGASAALFRDSFPRINVNYFISLESPDLTVPEWLHLGPNNQPRSSPQFRALFFKL
ncbi:uncharacterized protein ARMOST_01107 [Armillaria ostoyae]|uniref:Uncharacterized protein n=1 Tax=Armillaria ostoyae TaxID=47428 RepID=A0A284QN07_ARMOS|nr:uncharacterized protein ARMOST_01107 [Armillaria ostoyae]